MGNSNELEVSSDLVIAELQNVVAQLSTELAIARSIIKMREQEIQGLVASQGEE